MINEDKIVIPHDIILFVPKKAPSIAFIAGVSDKKSSYTTGRRNFYYNAADRHWPTEDDFIPYTIPNTGIELWLGDEEQFSGFTTIGENGYYNYTNVWIGITSPEIQSIYGERTIKVPVSREVIWKLLLKYRNIRQGGRIPGLYSLVSDRYGTVTPILEKKVSKSQELAKKAGELAQKKMTSTWIPGHLYLTKKQDYILYLGELEGLCTIQGWDTYERTRRVSSHYSLDKTSAYKIDKGRIFVYIQDLSDLPRKMPILDFIRDEVIKKGEYTLYIRDWCAPWTGADLAEVLEEDKDAGLKIKAWAESVIGSMRGFTGITNEQNHALSLSPGSVKNYPKLLQRYKDLKIALIKDAISDALKSTYYSSSPAPKNVDELWKSYTTTGWWCGKRNSKDFMDRIFWDATEDELKEELKRCF